MEIRGKLGDINQKPKPIKCLTKEDLVENPDEFDELRYFEQQQKKQESLVNEAKIDTAKNVNKKVQKNMSCIGISFKIGGAFKRKFSYIENIPKEWVVTREEYKKQFNKNLYDATIFIYTEFIFNLGTDNLTFQLDGLRKILYLLEKSRDWNEDENCMDGNIIIQEFK